MLVSLTFSTITSVSLLLSHSPFVSYSRYYSSPSHLRLASTMSILTLMVFTLLASVACAQMASFNLTSLDSSVSVFSAGCTFSPSPSSVEFLTAGGMSNLNWVYGWNTIFLNKPDGHGVQLTGSNYQRFTNRYQAVVGETASTQFVLAGGMQWYKPTTYTTLNDVWFSTDGLSWYTSSSTVPCGPAHNNCTGLSWITGTSNPSKNAFYVVGGVDSTGKYGNDVFLGSWDPSTSTMIWTTQCSGCAWAQGYDSLHHASVTISMYSNTMAIVGGMLQNAGSSTTSNTKVYVSVDQGINWSLTPLSPNTYYIYPSISYGSNDILWVYDPFANRLISYSGSGWVATAISNYPLPTSGSGLLYGCLHAFQPSYSSLGLLPSAETIQLVQSAPYMDSSVGAVTYVEINFSI